MKHVTKAAPLGKAKLNTAAAADASKPAISANAAVEGMKNTSTAAPPSQAQSNSIAATDGGKPAIGANAAGEDTKNASTAAPSSRAQSNSIAAADGGKPAINVNAAVEAANLVKETCEALNARKAELGTELRALDEQVAKLWNAPVTRDEAKQLVLGSVDAFASEFPTSINWSKFFEPFAKPNGQREPYLPNGTSYVRTHDGLLSLVDLDRIQKLGMAPGTRSVFGLEQLGLLAKADTATIEGALCFFFGDRVKQLVESRFNSTFPEHLFPKKNGSALTIAERRAEIESLVDRAEAINEDLSRVEAQLVELAPAKSAR